MADLIKPQQVQIDDIDGETRTYLISRVPATVGRKVLSQYLTANLPKVGSYDVSEGIMLELLSYTAVTMEDGGELRLKTKALIDNHVPDWETLVRLEKEMMAYNTGFFQNGRASAFFSGFLSKLQQLITATWTTSLAQSSQAGKPPSTN